MPRKKTEQQIEFAKTVEYREASNGVMKPVKYLKSGKPNKKRKDAGTGTPLKVIKIDAALYDYIISHKGDMSIIQYANQLIRKGAGL